jgi:hypothetical protein
MKATIGSRDDQPNKDGEASVAAAVPRTSGRAKTGADTYSEPCSACAACTARAACGDMVEHPTCTEPGGSSGAISETTCAAAVSNHGTRQAGRYDDRHTPPCTQQCAEAYTNLHENAVVGQDSHEPAGTRSDLRSAGRGHHTIIVGQPRHGRRVYVVDDERLPGNQPVARHGQPDFAESDHANTLLLLRRNGGRCGQHPPTTPACGCRCRPHRRCAREREPNHGQPCQVYTTRYLVRHTRSS